MALELLFGVAERPKAICGAVVANLGLSTGIAGCNPDVNYGVVSLITRWTPVNNLTFSADLAYTMLDQKYAIGSTVALPLQSGVAKPGATYELKDQSGLTLLLCPAQLVSLRQASSKKKYVL